MEKYRASTAMLWLQFAKMELTKNVLVKEDMTTINDAELYLKLPELFANSQMHYWLYLTLANQASGIQGSYLGTL